MVKKVPVASGFVSSRLVWSPEETDLDPVAVRLPRRLRARLAYVFRALVDERQAYHQRGEKAQSAQILLRRGLVDSSPHTLIGWVKILDEALRARTISNPQRSGRIVNS
jgi:hypothetical protein